MATIDGIGLAEPSTITKSLAGVLVQRNGSNTYQEVMVLGSPNSTTALALAEIQATAPASTTMGLVVRVASGPSSAADLLVRPVFSSTNTDNPVRAILSSTNTDNPVRAILSSTSADNPVTATFASSANSVLSRATTSSGGLVEGSTNLPAVGALGLHVAQIVPTLTITNSTAGSDSIASLVSSNAASKAYVTAYTVNSTEAGPIQAGFYAGATLVWPVTIWATGGVVKDAQSVPHPSYLFKGSTGAALTFNVPSTGHYRVAITYWTGA